jgi:hypothetical protein
MLQGRVNLREEVQSLPGNTNLKNLTLVQANIHARSKASEVTMAVRLVYVFICLLLIALGMSYVVNEPSFNSSSRNTILCISLSCILRYIDYTLIIPTVQVQTMSAGGSAALGGLVIGVYWGSGWLGILLYWRLSLERISFRVLMTVGTSVYPITSAIYFSSSLVPTGLPTLIVMFASRCIAGLVQSVMSIRSHTENARIQEETSSTKPFLVYTMAECFGNALGPLLTSFVFDAMEARSAIDKRSQNVIPSAVMFCVHSAALTVLMWAQYGKDSEAPSEACIQSSSTDESRESSLERAGATQINNAVLPAWQVSVLVVTLLYAMFSVTESASALALEVRCGWSVAWIGYAIAGCFILYLPVTFLLDYVTRYMSDGTIVLSSLVAACIMTTPLFPQVPQMLQSLLPWKLEFCIAICIISSDVFVYPLACVANSISEARSYTLAGPEHADLVSVFLEAATLVYMVSQPLARFLVDRGMEQYACLQLVLTGIALCLSMGIPDVSKDAKESAA